MATILAAASSCTTSPPEKITADFLKQAEEAFADRNILALKKLVSPDYSDAENRGAGDVVSIAAAYIRSSKSIYLFSDLESAAFKDDRLEARVLTAFAARPIMDPTALAQLKADIYWFDIVLVQEGGDWKLLEAQWRQAMVDDFFREENNK